MSLGLIFIIAIVVIILFCMYRYNSTPKYQVIEDFGGGRGGGGRGGRGGRGGHWRGHGGHGYHHSGRGWNWGSGGGAPWYDYGYYGPWYYNYENIYTGDPCNCVTKFDLSTGSLQDRRNQYFRCVNNCYNW